MRLDVNDDVEITRRAAPRAHLAFARQANLGAGVNTFGNVHPYLLFSGPVATAGATPAGALDHLALPIAPRAAGDIDDLPEDRLRRPPHLAGAAALGTRLGRGARFGTASVAGLAGLG